MTGTENTQATEARCLGCRRPIRSAESLAIGYGAGCRARIRKAARAADLSAWTPEQVADALQAIEDGAAVPTSRKGVYLIVSRDGERIRKTHSAGCNCENGLKTRQPRPCWHRCLVAIMLASQAPAADVITLVPAPVALPASAAMWAEIERLNEAFMAMA